MTYVSKKKINNKEYTYLVKSIRMPNGKVKKIQKLIHDTDIQAAKEKNEKYFLNKEKHLYQNYAINTYKIDHVFTKNWVVS